MDQEILVKVGHEFLALLDETRIKPRVAMWVSNPEMGLWKLWIVPAKKFGDIHEFYRIASELITGNREKLNGLEISSIEMKEDSHPAMQGLRYFGHAPNFHQIQISQNEFNGYYLPDGIVLRMAL